MTDNGVFQGIPNPPSSTSDSYSQLNAFVHGPLFSKHDKLQNRGESARAAPPPRPKEASRSQVQDQSRFHRQSYHHLPRRPLLRHAVDSYRPETSSRIFKTADSYGWEGTIEQELSDAMADLDVRPEGRGEGGRGRWNGNRKRRFRGKLLRAIEALRSSILKSLRVRINWNMLSSNAF